MLLATLLLSSSLSTTLTPLEIEQLARKQGFIQQQDCRFNWEPESEEGLEEE